MLQHSPTETHDRAFKVNNGKHDPVAKTVVAFAIVLNHQPGFYQQCLLRFFCLIDKFSLKVPPTRRSIANGEMTGCRPRYAPLFKIGDGTGRVSKLLPVKPGGNVHNFTQFFGNAFTLVAFVGMGFLPCVTRPGF